MLIGRQAMDKSRPSREHNLVEWARPLLVHNRKLLKILDPRVEGQYSIKSAQKLANLAYQCLSQNPKGRPTMSQVVEILESIQTLSEEEEMLFQSSGSAVTLYEASKEALDGFAGGRSGSKKREGNREERGSGRRRLGDGRSRSEPPKESDLNSPSPDSGSSHARKGSFQ